MSEEPVILDRCDWDEFIAGCDKLKKENKTLREALSELHATVVAESPSLLDEDCGGDARLDSEIKKILKLDQYSI